MITSLSNLVMRKYVELVCGDTSVLTSRGEVVSPARLHEVRRKLLFDFATLSDSAGTKVTLTNYERRRRAEAEVLLFQLLNNALVTGAYDEVRKVLREYGVAREFSDEELVREVGSLMRRAKSTVQKYAQEEEPESREQTPDEIRTQFDRQAASLMTYFKFQIDFDKMPASQFACMIDQAHKEIKAKIAAYSKKQ